MDLYISKVGKKYAVISEPKSYTVNVLTSEIYDINKEMIGWIKENYTIVDQKRNKKLTTEFLQAIEVIRKIVDFVYQLEIPFEND